MSALSEGSTPAQDAGSASIDTQQLHQLAAHNGDPSQQLQPGSSGSGTDASRKRVYFIRVFVFFQLIIYSKSALGETGMHGVPHRQNSM